MSAHTGPGAARDRLHGPSLPPSFAAAAVLSPLAALVALVALVALAAQVVVTALVKEAAGATRSMSV